MTSEPAAASRGDLADSRIFSFLPRSLFQTERPTQAIVVGWLTAFLPSILLSLLMAASFPDAARPSFDLPPAIALFALVVFAPLIETLIMGGALLLLRLFLAPVPAVVISSVGWGFAHSLQAPVWGLIIWWPFLIFSILFLVWRERSLVAAFAIPATVHASQNLLPALAIVGGLQT